MGWGSPFLPQTGFHLSESQGGLEPIAHSTGGGSKPTNGPWQSAAHVEAMRASTEAQEAFTRILSLRTEMTPDNYEVVEHVVVGGGQA